MGNWRTVRLEGTCDTADVHVLERELTCYARNRDRRVDEWEHVGPLSYSGGIFGLPMWAAPIISAHGNLFERNYSVQDVAEDLRHLVTIALSLSLLVHCGGEYEDQTCIATIVAHAGKVVISKPQVRDVGELTADDTRRRTITALREAGAFRRGP